MTNSKAETMVHPFTGIPCEMVHLNPGDPIEPGDVYRSATLIEENSGLGKWFAAGPVFGGTVVGKESNVHFIRLLPIAGATPVAKPKKEGGERGFRGNRS